MTAPAEVRVPNSAKRKIYVEGGEDRPQAMMSLSNSIRVNQRSFDVGLTPRRATLVVARETTEQRDMIWLKKTRSKNRASSSLELR